MLTLNPSGEYLKNFCDVHLWVYDDKGELLRGGNLMVRIQFYFIRQRLRRLAMHVEHLMLTRGIFDFDKIVQMLPWKERSAWDTVLVYTVVKERTSALSRRNNPNPEIDVAHILAEFIGWINFKENRFPEVLNLRLQMRRLKCLPDLTIVAALHGRTD